MAYSRERSENGIVVHRIPRVPGALTLAALRRLNYWIYSQWVQLLVKVHQIDVVVGCFLAAPPSGCRVVLDVCDNHSAYWREFRHHPAYAEEIEQAEAHWIACADTVVAVGQVLAEGICRHAGRRADQKVVVIPNGVDLERFRAATRVNAKERLGMNAGRPVVSLVGIFGEFAGLDLFVEAAGELGDAEVQFLVIGDGVQLSRAREIARSRKIAAVSFLGRVPYADIPAYLAATDVGVLAKRKSAFTDAACPIKLIEYAAAGCVAVSTDLAEVRRMGFANVQLVPDTSTALAAGIRSALSARFEPPADLDRYDIRTVSDAYARVIE